MEGKRPLTEESGEDTTNNVLLPPQSQAVPPGNKRTVVDHTYHDYSRVFEAVDRKKGLNFPAKLHLILSDPGCSHIISWMPHGRAWKIHKRELLISEVIPKYFSHRSFGSFTRQISGWGFKRLHQPGNDFNAVYHECFLRGLPHLTGMMKRVSPNQGRLTPNMEGEPNFYDINTQFPMPPPMMPCQGQFQYHPSHNMEADAGYGAPQEPPAGYHTSPNQSSSSSGTYGPTPPFYGHFGDPYAVAAYNPLMGGYPYSPPEFPMQYGHHPYVQNPHYSYPPGGPPHFILSNSDTAPPSGAGTVKSEEVPSTEAVRKEVAITLQK